MPVTREHMGEWLDAYFAAWRSNEAAEVEARFAPDAVYSYGPFREPARTWQGADRRQLGRGRRR